MKLFAVALMFLAGTAYADNILPNDITPPYTDDMQTRAANTCINADAEQRTKPKWIAQCGISNHEIRMVAVEEAIGVQFEPEATNLTVYDPDTGEAIGPIFVNEFNDRYNYLAYDLDMNGEDEFIEILTLTGFPPDYLTTYTAVGSVPWDTPYLDSSCNYSTHIAIPKNASTFFNEFWVVNMYYYDETDDEWTGGTSHVIFDDEGIFAQPTALYDLNYPYDDCVIVEDLDLDDYVYPPIIHVEVPSWVYEDNGNPKRLIVRSN